MRKPDTKPDAASRLMDLETPIHDAVTMTRIASVLMDERFDKIRDVPGVGRGTFVDAETAELLMWAVYRSQTMAEEAQQAWRLAVHGSADQ